MRRALRLGVMGCGALALAAGTAGAVVACAELRSGYPEYDGDPVNPSLALSEGQQASINNARGSGSSSVVPVLNRLKQRFGEMQYLPSGSGAGFTAMLGGAADLDFAMTSSRKYPKADQVAAWEGHKNRTVTYARDAIAIALNPPSGLTYDGAPSVSMAALAALYDDRAANDPTWGTLLTNAKGSPSAMSAKPLAFGRNGGASLSGTSEAFWERLDDFVPQGASPDHDHAHLPQSQQTGEANSLALDAVRQRAGSLTYISLGYGLNNIAAGGYVLASVKAGDEEPWIPVADGKYPWTRPFNVIYRTDDEAGRLLAQYLLSDAGQAYAVQVGFLALTADGQTNEHVVQAGSDGSLLALDDVAFTAQRFKISQEQARVRLTEGTVGL